MSAQFIEIEGKQVVVIPADDYRVLLEKAEMLDDVAAYDRAKALQSGIRLIVSSLFTTPSAFRSRLRNRPVIARPS